MAARGRAGFLKRLKYGAVGTVEMVQSVPLYRRLAHAVRPPVTVKEATPLEYAAASRWLSGDAEPLPDVSASPFATHYVALSGARIVGFVQLVRHPATTPLYAGHWLFSLRVRLRNRGMGIAEQLCERVIAQAREEGAPELRLLVMADNRAALALYRKLGFDVANDPDFAAHLQQESLRFGRRRVLMSMALQP